MFTLGVAWSSKDKDTKSVHGLTDHIPSSPNTASFLYNVAWSSKDKDSKSVHGLTDQRSSLSNTASWVYNICSPYVLHGHVMTKTLNQYMV